MADERETLIEEFRKLGVARPESWASSQIREGIPQLGRARLLYKLWRGVVSHDNLGWIDDERRSHAMSEKWRPGTGDRAVPQVAVIDRMLAAGISVDDITTLVRQLQISCLFRFCNTLDDSGGGPPEAAGTHFGVFEVDANNNPIQPLNGLHESVSEFDREAIARRAAAKAAAAATPNGGPAAG
jgi:hypothetical protein